MGDKTCRGCEHLKQVCGIAEPFVDAGECICFAKKPKNLFDYITESPEVLAKSLVFWEGGWTSRFIKFTTTNREDAVSATVESLKEVLNEETSVRLQSYL